MTLVRSTTHRTIHGAAYAAERVTPMARKTSDVAPMLPTSTVNALPAPVTSNAAPMVAQKTPLNLAAITAAAQKIANVAPTKRWDSTYFNVTVPELAKASGLSFTTEQNAAATAETRRLIFGESRQVSEKKDKLLACDALTLARHMIAGIRAGEAHVNAAPSTGIASGVTFDAASLAGL